MKILRATKNNFTGFYKKKECTLLAEVTFLFQIIALKLYFENI